MCISLIASACIAETLLCCPPPPPHSPQSSHALPRPLRGAANPPPTPPPATFDPGEPSPPLPSVAALPPADWPRPALPRHPHGVARRARARHSTRHTACRAGAGRHSTRHAACQAGAASRASSASTTPTTTSTHVAVAAYTSTYLNTPYRNPLLFLASQRVARRGLGWMDATAPVCGSPGRRGGYTYDVASPYTPRTRSYRPRVYSPPDDGLRLARTRCSRSGGSLAQPVGVPACRLAAGGPASACASDRCAAGGLAFTGGGGWMGFGSDLAGAGGEGGGHILRPIVRITCRREARLGMPGWRVLGGWCVCNIQTSPLSIPWAIVQSVCRGVPCHVMMDWWGGGRGHGMEPDYIYMHDLVGLQTGHGALAPRLSAALCKRPLARSAHNSSFHYSSICVRVSVLRALFSHLCFLQHD